VGFGGTIRDVQGQWKSLDIKVRVASYINKLIVSLAVMPYLLLGRKELIMNQIGESYS